MNHSNERVISLIPQKKGRKYFECAIPGKGYKAQLVINEQTKDLDLGREVAVLAKDISERSAYGTQIRFEAIEIDTSLRLAAKQRFKSDMAKWMGFAQQDVAQGRYATNAMTQVRNLMVMADRNLDEQAVMQLKSEWRQLQEQVEANRQASKGLTAWERHKVNARSNYVIFPLNNLPEMGRPVEWNGHTVVFESQGRPFRIYEDAPSIQGAHLLGHEGELGCRVYFRVGAGARQESVHA